MPRKAPASPTFNPIRRQEASTLDQPGLRETRLAHARDVPLDQVVPDPRQPRQDWAHAGGRQRLDELAESIREFGVLQPLLVREEGTLPDGRTRYVVIAGGRRRAAAEIAMQRSIPVVVRGEESERIRLLQLTENLQRQDLAPLDEARAYQELLDAEEDLTPETLGKRLHISGQTIRDRLKVLADQVFADAVERKQIAATTARRIMMLPDAEIATLRTQVAAGERVTNTDVEEARRRTRAAGTTNPRRKGGGRAARPVADQVPPPLQDQNSFDLLTVTPTDQNCFDRQTVSSTQRPTPRMVAEHELEVVSLLRTGDGQAPQDEVVAALRRDLERLGQPEQ